MAEIGRYGASELPVVLPDARLRRRGCATEALELDAKCGYYAAMQCVQCKAAIPFEREKRRAKYCSDLCKVARQKEQWREQNERPEIRIASGTVGAIGELRAAAELLSKGYEVFRAVSQSCSCDLAILKDDELLRVEVRTGFYSPNGKLSYNRGRDRASSAKYDVMAVVSAKEIRFFGALGDPHPSVNITLVCAHCGQSFTKRKGNQRYCSYVCMRDAGADRDKLRPNRKRASI